MSINKKSLPGIIGKLRIICANKDLESLLGHIVEVSPITTVAPDDVVVLRLNCFSHTTLADARETIHKIQQRLGCTFNDEMVAYNVKLAPRRCFTVFVKVPWLLGCGW